MMNKQQHTWFSLSSNISFDQLNGDSMRRILVINNRSLLEEGLLSLLASKDGLDVLSIDFDGEEALVRNFNFLHPDVIIINRESSINLARLLGLLSSNPDFSRLYILVISADSNMIDVYENQQVYELHSQDFFDFLSSVAQGGQ
ncbi:MAG: hypothetical protein ABI904_02010 [Chloroflexota bacterium]